MREEKRRDGQANEPKNAAFIPALSGEADEHSFESFPSFNTDTA